MEAVEEKPLSNAVYAARLNISGVVNMMCIGFGKVIISPVEHSWILGIISN